jgi:hypothetical protein
MKKITPTIDKHLNRTKRALATLTEFLLSMFLGCIAAILLVIPWLLRIVAVLVWLTAAFIGIETIHSIYGPYSPAIPVIALQFAVILASVSWIAFLLNRNARFLWGGMVAGGLVISGISLGATWMLEHWKYANLFFRVLPPALFSILLIHETVRLRAMRKSGELKNPFHKANDRHESDNEPKSGRRDNQSLS